VRNIVRVISNLISRGRSKKPPKSALIGEFPSTLIIIQSRLERFRWTHLSAWVLELRGGKQMLKVVDKFWTSILRRWIERVVLDKQYEFMFLQDHQRPTTNMLCLVLLKLCFIQLIGLVFIKKSWEEKPRAIQRFLECSGEEFLSRRSNEYQG
jgi:hypothetical protein